MRTAVAKREADGDEVEEEDEDVAILDARVPAANKVAGGG